MEFDEKGTLGFVISLVICSLVQGGRAEGSALHLFGPAGTDTERRILGVFEGDDGRCVPWDDVELEAVDDGVTIFEEDQAGSCVQWLRISTEEPQETVTIRARAPGGQATSTMGLSREESLQIRVSRSGREIAARIGRGETNEQLSAHAYWEGGSVALERTPQGAYRGLVPTDVPVGVVARSGGVVGATLSVPDSYRSDHVSVILMPSELAVPAGGASRTAAFLIVTNQHGRPSNTVPLNIASDRGRLRGMTWLGRGLAAIQLSTEVGVSSVDLTVSFRDEVFGRAELPVSAGWAVSAQIEEPTRVVRGEDFDLTLSATTLDGAAVAPTDLRLRCGGEESAPDEAGRATCNIAANDPSAVLVVGASVDGRFVPLGSRQVTVEAPPEEPRPPPVELVDEQPAMDPTDESRRSAFLGPLIQGGLDLFWLRGTFAFGLRVEIPLIRWFHLDVGATYSVTPFTNEPSTDVNTEGPLEGYQHTTELAVTGGFELFQGHVTMVLRGGVGVAYAAMRATLGQRDASGNAIRATALLSLGPRIHFGRTKLGFELGARAPMASSDGTWSDAPLRLLMEVNVTVGLGG